MTGTGRFFRLSVPEGYEWVVPDDSADFDVIRAIAERPAGASWRPIGVSLLSVDDAGRRQRRADLPWLGAGTLVLRDDALSTIGELLKPHGELLALDCNDARLAMFSAPAVTGVLDQDKSEVVRFGSGRIMAIRRPVFRLTAVGDLQAFKVSEMPRGDLFLAEELVAAIRDTGMTSGTEFAAV